MKRPMWLSALLLLALMSGTSAFCQCIPTTTAATTWGGNANVVLKEPKPIRSAQGTVKDELDKPLAGVLVEIYDHPEIAIRNPSPNRAGQTRIAACLTNQTGMFSLDVAPGHYELRLSKSKEWNVTSVPISIAKSARPSKKGLVVRLSVGH